MPTRAFTLLTLLLALGVLLAAAPPSTRAQGGGGIQVLTTYAVTAYSRPDRTSAIVGVFNPHAKVILETRSADATWVLGRSTDGEIRGWFELRYVDLPNEANIAALWFSSEEIYVVHDSGLEAAAQINLDDYPIIPSNLGRAAELYQHGRTAGLDIHTVAKVGDCITDNVSFLSPFGSGAYILGDYGYLQEAINFYGASLASDSLAAYDGLVTAAALDPLFANPNVCLEGESPLRCEYRVHHPGVAVIMFGAQDLLFVSAADFDTNLRRIVHETTQAGVIPVLSTFPGNLALWSASVRYNQIVVQVALDYDVPLINLWRALDGLPYHGLNDDGRHLSLAITRAGDLTPANLQRGYPMRNLVTLQALDAVMRGVMGE